MTMVPFRIRRFGAQTLNKLSEEWVMKVFAFVLLGLALLPVVVLSAYMQVSLFAAFFGIG